MHHDRGKLDPPFHACMLLLMVCLPEPDLVVCVTGRHLLQSSASYGSSASSGGGSSSSSASSAAGATHTAAQLVVFVQWVGHAQRCLCLLDGS